jgi:hypothetical protein
VLFFGPCIVALTLRFYGFMLFGCSVSMTSMTVITIMTIMTVINSMLLLWFEWMIFE